MAPHLLVLQVLRADIDTQKKIAPFLKNKLLRTVVESLANSPDNDFESWANNKQVLDSLSEAQRLLDTGHMTVNEMENLFLAHLTKEQQVPIEVFAGN